jgi:transposase
VWFKKLAGDKGYSSESLRRWLQRRGTQPVIPEPASRTACRSGPAPPLDRRAYRKRNVIERAVGWLKERRRIATRYEKLAVNYVTMLTIAVMEKYWRVLLPNTP